MSAQTKEGAPETGRPDEPNDPHSTMSPEAAEEIAAGLKEESAEGETESAPDAVAELRAELDEMRSNMLRALAEAENVRRRAQRDVADARQYAVTAFARDLLNVSDNFKRALSTISDDETLPEEMKGLVEGVRMTERELGSIFERHGVKMIEPTGERFDPNRHQAMFEIEDPSVPSGTVLQVMQAGAVIGDRTLRPAMVGVSKGGPKPGEAPKAADNGGASEGDAG